MSNPKFEVQDLNENEREWKFSLIQIAVTGVEFDGRIFNLLFQAEDDEDSDLYLLPEGHDDNAIFIDYIRQFCFVEVAGFKASHEYKVCEQANVLYESLKEKTHRIWSDYLDCTLTDDEFNERLNASEK